MIRLVLALLASLLLAPTAALAQCSVGDTIPDCFLPQTPFRSGEIVSSSRSINFGHGSIVPFTTGSGAITLTVPSCDQNPQSGTAFPPNKLLTFVDVGGAAARFPLTIQPASGLIKGKPSVVMRTAGGSLTIQWTTVVDPATGAWTFTCRLLTPWTGYNEFTFGNVGGSGVALASSTVAVTQTVGSTSLTFTSVTGFPATPFLVAIGDELELVNSCVITVCDVTRAYNGTTAVQHEVGEVITQGLPLTALNGAINASQTSIAVNNGASFPSTNALALIGTEQVFCTSGCNTNSWTVLRGQNGTTAGSWPNGTQVAQLAPSTTLSGSITDVATQLTLTVSLKGSGPYLVSIDGEHVRLDCTTCTAGPTPITRGLNGTTPAAHSSGAPVLLLDTQCQTLPANGSFLGKFTGQAVGGNLPDGLDLGTAIGLSDIYQGFTLTLNGRSAATIADSATFLSNTADTQVCVSPHRQWGRTAVTLQVPFRARLPY